MNRLETPDSHTSRRKPFGIITNNKPSQYQATKLNDKVNNLEIRLQNLSNIHLSNRTPNQQHKEMSLSPYSNQMFSSNKKAKENILNEYKSNTRKNSYNKIISHSPFLDNKSSFTRTNDVTSYDLLGATFQTRKEPSSIEHHFIKMINAETKSSLESIKQNVKKFKQQREDNQDSIQIQLAKLKCFCQDYYDDCFDFYRCTDLQSLKYMIYLLIQDLNNKTGQSQQKIAYLQAQYDQLVESYESSKLNQIQNSPSHIHYLQRVSKEVSSVLDKIIDEIKFKLPSTQGSNSSQKMMFGQIEHLNDKMRTIQNEFESFKDKISADSTYITKSESPLKDLNKLLKASRNAKQYESDNNRFTEAFSKKASNQKENPLIQTQQLQIDQYKQQISTIDNQKLELQFKVDLQQDELAKLNERILVVNSSLDKVVSTNKQLKNQVNFGILNGHQRMMNQHK